MQDIKVGKYKYRIAPVVDPDSNKKYIAYPLFDLGKVIKFGDKRYQQYQDKIGYYSNLDHNDKTRRKNYRKRHEAIEKNKNGKKIKAYKDPLSSAFLSYHLLW